MDWSHLSSMWVGLVPGCTSAPCVLKPGATRPTFWSTWSQNTSLTHLHTVVHSVIGPSALRQRSKLTKVPTIGTTEIFYNKFTLHIIVRYMLDSFIFLNFRHARSRIIWAVPLQKWGWLLCVWDLLPHRRRHHQEQARPAQPRRVQTLPKHIYIQLSLLWEDFWNSQFFCHT